MCADTHSDRKLAKLNLNVVAAFQQQKNKP